MPEGAKAIGLAPQTRDTRYIVRSLGKAEGAGMPVCAKARGFAPQTLNTHYSVRSLGKAGRRQGRRRQGPRLRAADPRHALQRAEANRCPEGL